MLMVGRSGIPSFSKPAVSTDFRIVSLIAIAAAASWPGKNALNSSPPNRHASPFAPITFAMSFLFRQSHAHQTDDHAYR